MSISPVKCFSFFSKKKNFLKIKCFWHEYNEWMVIEYILCKWCASEMKKKSNKRGKQRKTIANNEFVGDTNTLQYNESN